MFIPKISSPNPSQIVQGENYRFTVLTPRLIRLEYGSAFEDRPSQAFWFRQQTVPAFRVVQQPGRIEIITDHLHLAYQPTPAGFTPNTLTIRHRQGEWHYGDPDTANLLGTTRTLDTVSGQTNLEPGLMSRAGWVVVDDSQSLVFNEAGWLEPRSGRNLDLYFFGYGHDYLACLADYCQISGRTPLLPRWVLGNWWSRYWEYSADDLMKLMTEFQNRAIPLSVCIVDMDWHLTQTGNRASGWTGYTWNRELFPDPAGFIRWLHEQGLKTALNLHPAEGVHPHEEQYPQMAEAMGVDPAGQQPIPFAIHDPQFAQAYFQILHHPHEAQGIDFWWLDWQQGKKTGLAGLDPLWWLNHLHFYDLGRDGQKRPFIFSRWGGLGNHRYPIGFSGDTHVTWESLAFQPYFTATAANVGYGWWSHDIGGHMFGLEDSELYARWVQFGLFSPIFRLHSTKNPYHDRRPWGHPEAVYQASKAAMQLRHAFIPYLYTMSWLNESQHIPPIRPIYYDTPTAEAAYHCPNQYTFGTELIAAPFVQPTDPHTRLSRQLVWFPAGTSWFNFFNGQPYPGDSWQTIYGSLEDIPVFAKAGAIVPMGPKVGWGGLENPLNMEVTIFPGRDNQFTLFEDDGQTMAYQQGDYALTVMRQSWQAGQLQFTIEPVQGNHSHIPAGRTYSLCFRGVSRPEQLSLSLNGQNQAGHFDYDSATLTVQLPPIPLSAGDSLTVTLRGANLLAAGQSAQALCAKLLGDFRLDTGVKNDLVTRLAGIVADPAVLAPYAIALSQSQLTALLETLTGAGIGWIDPAGPHEQLILWNNRQNPAIRYQFSAFAGHVWDFKKRYRYSQEEVPAFKAIEPKTISGRWQLHFTYFNLPPQTFHPPA